MSAPSHLRPATRTWFDSVVDSFELEPHHLKLLELAATAWDEAELARKAVAKHGITYQDRYDRPHSRPEIAIQRDARIAFVRILRELSLDIEPPRDDTRLPAIRR